MTPDVSILIHEEDTEMSTTATHTRFDDVDVEFEHIRDHSSQIKKFVARHGEHSAMIFARALTASSKQGDEYFRFLVGAPRDDDFDEACQIVRSIGRDAAALLPQLVFTYYHRAQLDLYV